MTHNVLASFNRPLKILQKSLIFSHSLSKHLVTFGIAGGLALAATVAALRGGLFWPAGDYIGVRIAAAMVGVAFAGRAIGEGRYVGLLKRVTETRFAAGTPGCSRRCASSLREDF